MVAFQQVLDRLNDLFGSEDFTESQKVSFLEALLQTLLEDAALVQQAKVNSAKQFVESPDFDGVRRYPRNLMLYFHWPQ